MPQPPGIPLDDRTRAALTRLRERKKLTQQQVADRVGVSQKTISEIESGGYDPPMKLLEKLARLLGQQIETRTQARLRKV